MSLNENIRDRRQELRLSQEYVADQLGVSRQAVSKWETGQSIPSAGNLADLAMLLETRVSDLVDPKEDAAGQADFNDLRSAKKSNRILRLNLSLLAIAFQAGALYSCTQVPFAVADGGEAVDTAFMLFKIAVLLVCSCWMAFNMRFEENAEQRRKNVRIELLYCIAQLVVALVVLHFGMSGLAGLSPTALVALVYILYVNPKYMNRPFGKKQAA